MNASTLMNPSNWLPMTEPLRLSRASVQIVHLDLTCDDRQLDRWKATLSPDESARADRFKVPLPRRCFIVCRGVLRHLLGRCVDQDPRRLEFDYGPHGKPSLRPTSAAQPAIQFSVSHSANQALIAVTVGRPVGVDIEQQDPSVRILKLAQRFFSPREAAELMSLPAADQLAGFYRGWTCKEAYLKATGFGLSFPLSKFSVALDPRQPTKLIDVADQPSELNRWRLSHLDPTPNYSAAIMFEAQPAEQIVLQQWICTPDSVDAGAAEAR